MQFVNETLVCFNEALVYAKDTTQYLKELFKVVYVEHPNAYLHVLITMLLTIILLTNLHIKLTRKRLNETDKRYTILLLTIQKYCVSLNRAVNEVLEKSDKNTQLIMDNDDKILFHIRKAHQRVKDAYTGLFKHLDIKKLKRAPKKDAQENTEESADHKALIREAIDEMIVTDFSSNS